MYMRALVQEKQRAIELRKKGYSYRDIMHEVDAAKSSISLWLHKLPLTRDERKHLKSRRNHNISRGRIKAGAALHTRRLERDKILFEKTRIEFDQNKHDPLFFVGIALYWAEGAKRSSTFSFTNSDSDMINIMLNWIEKFWQIPRSAIKVRLFSHKPYAHERCEERWAREINISPLNFKKTIYKPTGLLVKKRPDYKGCLRVELGKTTNLRRMQFLQNMLLEYLANSE